MKAFLALVGCLLVHTAFAQTQIPNIFSAGQPARAAEVNENFSTLAGSIDQVSTENAALDGRLTMLETTGGTGCELGIGSGWSSAHTPTYNYIPTTVGSAVLNGAVLVRIPFVELGSGQRYVLDFPMYNAVPIDIHFSHVKPVNPDCTKLSISGFPASVEISDGKVYTWSSPFRGITTEIRHDVSTTIWVAETAISITTGVLIPEINYSTGVDTYDYTNLFPTPSLWHVDDVTNGFDDFIDYLHIEVAP